MTMLIVRSWIVASNSNLGTQLPPALQSPFSFHLGYGDAQKMKKKKKRDKKVLPIVEDRTPSDHCMLLTKHCSNCFIGTSIVYVHSTYFTSMRYTTAHLY